METKTFNESELVVHDLHVKIATITEICKQLNEQGLSEIKLHELAEIGLMLVTMTDAAEAILNK